MSIIIAEYLHCTFYFPHRPSYNIPSIKIGITTKVATGTPMEYKWFLYPRFLFCDQWPYCRPPTSLFLAWSWTPACIQTPLNCPISYAYSATALSTSHSFPSVGTCEGAQHTLPQCHWYGFQIVNALHLLRFPILVLAQIPHSCPCSSPQAGYRDFLCNARISPLKSHETTWHCIHDLLGEDRWHKWSMLEIRQCFANFTFLDCYCIEKVATAVAFL